MSVKGAHGFDNAFPEMHAVFMMQGPAAERMKAGAGAHADQWTSLEPAVMKRECRAKVICSSQRSGISKCLPSLPACKSVRRRRIMAPKGSGTDTSETSD